jgi:hypothetical protein
LHPISPDCLQPSQYGSHRSSPHANPGFDDEISIVNPATNVTPTIDFALVMLRLPSIE